MYDSDTSHVAYICHNDNETKQQYGAKSLYCNNHFSEVVRETVRMVTFRACDYSKLQNIFGLYEFKDLRVFNVSASQIEYLSGTMFKSNNHLENFIASRNSIKRIPTNLFAYTPELMEVDLSYNKIEQLKPEVFNGTQKMKTILISHNQIRVLSSQMFVNLLDLEVLDISHNRIELIDDNSFISNKKLKSLDFRNNPLIRLQCGLLTTLRSFSLTISFTSVVKLETNCANETSSIESNVTVSSRESTSSALTIAGGRFDWVFTKNTFNNILHLNFLKSDMKHIPSLLEVANPQLISLDLSNTLVDALSEETFQKFTNLQTLCLSRTNLSNFQFATFHHQTKLKILDLSYNNLTSIDFRPFESNFQHLELLHLEGNKLTEIDSITRDCFPKLHILAISKNRFTCHYLLSFLHQWQDLTIVGNPTWNETQVDGVDCFNENHSTDETSHNEPIDSNCPSNELILLIISIILILIICLYLFMIRDKCSPIRKLYKNWTGAEMTNESISFTHRRLSESALY